MWKKLIYKRKHIIYPKSVGVLGFCHGYGATHIALTIANFLKSKEGYPVAYIELREKSALLDIIGKECAEVNSVVGFDYMGVLYVPACTHKEARRIIDCFQGRVVIDIGGLEAEDAEILKLCEKRMILGSIMPWYKTVFQSFINKMSGVGLGVDSVEFYTKDKVNRNERTMEDGKKVKFKVIPQIDNPFKIRQKDFDLITELLYEQGA